MDIDTLKKLWLALEEAVYRNPRDRITWELVHLLRRRRG